MNKFTGNYRADISNIGIPIGWVSVDNYVVLGWDGNSGDVLDEGGEGDSWLAEAVDEPQCPFVLGGGESSWANSMIYISPTQRAACALAKW